MTESDLHLNKEITRFCNINTMGKTEIVENERVKLYAFSFKVYVNSVYCSLDKNMICNGVREEIP